MSRLKTFFSYKKFARPETRILFLDKGYFLQRESIAALKKMGHKVLTLPVAENPKTMLENLLKQSLDFKPDSVFTMNHFGFDSAGKIAAVLAELNIPVLVWYLDDYRFIIPNTQLLAQPNVLMATIEKDDITVLREIGFEHVIYLPTATALNPLKNYSNPQYAYLSPAVSFVGNSFQATKTLWYRPGYEELLKKLPIQLWIEKRRQTFIDFCRQHVSSADDANHFCGYAAAQATQLYRLKTLKNLKHTDLHVFGDDYWQTALADAVCHPPLHNLKEAPAVFAASAVNLNISSCQLRRAVNLRVFDIPISGGFLLTDYRPDLEELFDVHNELAVYRSQEELQDKLDFYLSHPAERRRVARNAAERIRQQHLLPMRLEALLKRAKRIFSS